MPAAKAKAYSSGGGGTVFKGADGSLYFVRDELLETLKVEGEAAQKLQEVMKSGGVKAAAAPSSSAGSIKAAGYVKGALLKDPRNTPSALKAARTRARASTIMCPWFCSHDLS